MIKFIDTLKKLRDFMMHNPIRLIQLGLSFPHKTCFENFNATIMPGDRIVIMGRNGSGKSSLLNLLRGASEPSAGNIELPGDICMGYVPQIIQTTNPCSGGQGFHKALTQALCKDPNVLLLDEPTNHLDHNNRTSLLRMLQAYVGTLIIVSHDIELLRSCATTLWHIDNGNIHSFAGHYDDYLQNLHQQRAAMEQTLAHLAKQKKQLHVNLMKEQERAKKRKIYGEKKYDGDKLALRSAQGRGQQTQNKNRKRLTDDKHYVLEQLSKNRLPELIKPTFSLLASEIHGRTLVSISDGSVGYDKPLLRDIQFSLVGGHRIALTGNNGCGKSTLLKALLEEPCLTTTGHWQVPKKCDIGYLDQHYQTLSLNETVLDALQKIVPHWNNHDLRRHLNSFLFRKNDEVNAPVAQLSGGEKARLCLAQIAAKTPKLLLLDEITNNLDIETCEHMIQVLREYPGAMIVISHDHDFLTAINIKDVYNISDYGLHLIHLPISKEFQKK